MAVSFQPYFIKSAKIGKCNPLPDIKNVGYIHAAMRVTDRAKEKCPKHFGEGMINSMLPYQTQDNYNRVKEDYYFNAAILENEYLKAVFLPELGGRLWSLIDKTTGRELLYKNPVFQPCNLALRNAWFSGGVEWNVSIKGHNPLTCSPMFASVIEAEDGERGLRLYEYERIRNIAYSMDIWLPKGAKYLIVHPRIENNTPDQKYNYWWSNIAYPDNKGSRVLVPASHSFVSSYRHGSYIMDYRELSHERATDETYPENNVDSYDYFYDIPEENEKWIAALDADGYGLFQCSTKELTGRKLFVWGTSRGGKNWNEFLSEKGSGYYEIQAGLAKTQLEHLPMSPFSVWEWTELYGAVQTSPSDSFSEDWARATNSVQAELTSMLGGGIAQRANEVFEKYKTAKTIEIKQYGSGWGCLKNRENELCGLPPVSALVEFPKDSISEEEAYFLALLNEGKFPCPSVNEIPVSYCFSEKLRAALSAYVNENPSNWFALYHLGVMEYAMGDVAKAQMRWEESVKAEKNTWAIRNLAMLERNEYGNFDKAVEYMKEAVSIFEGNRNLTQDYLETLMKAGKFEECVKAFDEISNDLKKIGKLQYCKAFALTKLEKYDEAAEIVNDKFQMDDIKEGDISIADLWYELYAGVLKKAGKLNEGDDVETVVEQYYPLGDLDFRMHTK